MCAESFTSVKKLTDAVTTYLNERNKHPRPYHWKASGRDFLTKIERARQALAEASN